MKPDAALCRSQRDVVLHAVTREHFDRSVVHLHRTGHDDLPFGRREDLPDARIEIEDASGSFELLEHRAEDVAL
jgi:hypothetical protein